MRTNSRYARLAETAEIRKRFAERGWCLHKPVRDTLGRRTARELQRDGVLKRRTYKYTRPAPVRDTGLVLFGNRLWRSE